MHRLDDRRGDLLECIENLTRAYGKRARQTGHQTASPDLHDRFLAARIHTADRALDLLCRAVADQRIVLTADVLDNGLVELIARDLDGRGLDNAAKRNNRHVGRAAANIDHQIAVGPVDVDARADGRRDRLLDQKNALCARLRARINDGTLLHLSDDGRHANDHIRLEQVDTLHLCDEFLDHALGHLVIRNNALAQRTDGDNVARCTAKHALRFLAHGKDFAGNLVHRHNGRLVKYNALALDIDQHGCRAEVDADIA